jgi:hypothetical protein
MLIAMALTLCFATSTKPNLNTALILDDFDDAYGDGPNRNCLGAIKSKYENGNGYAGDYGYWFPVCDKTYIARASGDTLQADSMKYMCQDKIMHIKMKVEQSTKSYPGAEIACNFFTDKDTFDLSKMTALVFKAKGTNSIRVGFKTYNILPDWGFLSAVCTLSTAWKTFNIPVAKLKPAPYSHSDTLKVAWDACKKKAFGFQIKTENSKDVDLSMDSIVFTGMQYSDVYKPTGVKPSFMVSPGYSSDKISIENGIVAYSINQPEDVSFSLIDGKGCLVQRLQIGAMGAGKHSFELPRSLGKGTYFIRMNNDGAVSQKFTIVK